MNTLHNTQPWSHWITDDFLTTECLAEVKTVEHELPQENSGRRVGSGRLFITDKHAELYPHLHQLYRSLHDGRYRQFFEQHTGIDYKNLYPRVEVISDIGPFYLEPHCDQSEKRLTALVYTDYQNLHPGTGFANGARVETKDNRCFFFVPDQTTWHDYPATTFDTVRRCLQINYWTYSL